MKVTYAITPEEMNEIREYLHGLQRKARKLERKIDSHVELDPFETGELDCLNGAILAVQKVVRIITGEKG